MSSHSLTCPVDRGRVPAVEGVEAVDGEWRLSVAAHEELLRTITGVVPSDEPDLQELATITARLEGYVDRKRRVTSSGASTSGGFGDETATESVGINLLKRLRRWLSSVWSELAGQHQDSDPEQQTPVEQYDAERVYELSRFFRTALDARRTAVEVEEPTGTTPPAAD